MAKLCGIYCITNTLDGKRYVGSSKDIDKRWRQHVIDLRAKTHHSQHLQRAWIKHGESAFKLSVLRLCDASDLARFEQAHIDLFQAADHSRGYNICIIAESSLGTKRTDETRERMSKAKRGKKLTEEHRRKIGLAGIGRKCENRRPASQETRDKISRFHKGRKASAETRLKMSQVAKTRKGTNTGRKFSDEHRARLSESNKKRRQTPEWIAKMAAKKRTTTDFSELDLA